MIASLPIETKYLLMKNLFFPLLIATVFIISCEKNEEPPIKEEPVTPVKPTDSVPADTVPAADVKIRKLDSIRKIVAANGSKYSIISDSVWADNNGITFRVQTKGDLVTTAFSVTPAIEQKIFPGALLKGNTFLNGTYAPLTGYQQNPVVLLSNSPLFDEDSGKITPSLALTNSFIKSSLAGSKSGQVDAIGFSNGIAFENYSEISMNSRASWDFSSLVIRQLGNHGHIKKKYGFYATFDLSIFSLDADYFGEGGSIFAPGTDAAAIPDNPVIISSVTYGRKAIIAIESDAAFQQIKTAFQAVIDKKASDADKKLLQESTITISMRGFNEEATKTIQVLKGYDQVSLFAQTLTGSGTFSATDYGVPVDFYCNSASDRSTVRKGFNFRLDYPVK